jgi:hypothetical protein
MRVPIVVFASEHWPAPKARQCSNVAVVTERKAPSLITNKFKWRPELALSANLASLGYGPTIGYLI